MAGDRLPLVPSNARITRHLQGRLHHGLHTDSAPSSPARPRLVLDHFADLADPRREQGRVHRLDKIVFIATCAVICGAESWVEIADYGAAKHDWLKTFLALPGGIPSHDTFRRVFCLLDPLAFLDCFIWMAALMAREGLTTLATIRPNEADRHRRQGPRGSSRASAARHCTWSAPGRSSITWLGQVAADAKSNEITAIPELLALLDLTGAIVTIDAMGCQKEIAAEISKGVASMCWPSRITSRTCTRTSAGVRGRPGALRAWSRLHECNRGSGAVAGNRTCCVITDPAGIRDPGCGRI